MTKNRYKNDSGILRDIHETAKDLQNHEFISKKRMAHYVALCLDPVPEYNSESIRSLRKKLKISQSVMASVINISVSTVQQWETGNKKPGGPSAKLLSLLEAKGLEALL